MKSTHPYSFQERVLVGTGGAASARQEGKTEVDLGIIEVSG